EAAGEPGRAESLAREALARQRKKGGPGPMADALASLGEILLRRADSAEAEPLPRECLAVRLKQKADDSAAPYARSLPGGALIGREEYTEAEPLLVQGYEGMKQRAARIPPHVRAARLTEALERLVRLYNAREKPDEAARWQQELEGVKSP